MTPVHGRKYSRANFAKKLNRLVEEIEEVNAKVPPALSNTKFKLASAVANLQNARDLYIAADH